MNLFKPKDFCYYMDYPECTHDRNDAHCLGDIHARNANKIVKDYLDKQFNKKINEILNEHETD